MHKPGMVALHMLQSQNLVNGISKESVISVRDKD